MREGRSFNPDEFAIALEQVVAGTAPEDYREPAKFYARTCFTRALREHSGMVLRRVAGETANTAPVIALITQFGGGKTHTLTALYHLVKNPGAAIQDPGVAGLLREAGLYAIPQARVAVFVGNAWDPREGSENPWVDLARQLAGDAGVEALGPSARDIPPGTESIGRLFDAAGGSVLVLFDEVLNFLNRHRALAEPFQAFLQNLTVAMTGTTRSAAVISLPRSQVEMTDWDMEWQERITKIVRRVAKDLIANDEAEIGEVVRRRLFEDLGGERARKAVARDYAQWCFERRAQLPPEWTAVDTAATEARAKDLLSARFEVCYPFHPATLSVFQRKWQALHQYQQTRGTLAMLAQWIAWAYREGWNQARREPLITLGSAPLEVAGFRSVVLGQLGEPRLAAAIEVDIAGAQAHARALDADTKGPLKDIHRRVAATILFESSGGQADKVAHLPELRFALGEPDLDTTSIDSAALAIESRSYFLRKAGSDGFKVHHQATLKKVVNDRRASLDDESEVRPAIRSLVRHEFERGGSVPVAYFPEDGAAVPDSPRLTLVLLDPGQEWSDRGDLRSKIAEWTRDRGSSPRLYPAALVWCVKKPGRDLLDKVEHWLAWQRVQREMDQGTLGSDYERADRAEVAAWVREAEEAARDEVWASYRYVVLADNQATDGVQAIDLGAGHASAGSSLCGRIVTVLRSEALLSESVGAGYIERNWPQALAASGAWPLSGLRQSFLNGALTRLLDADGVLKPKIVELVGRGDFGLGSSAKPDGTYERIWFEEPLPPEDVAFEAGVFLLKKDRAKALRSREAGSGPTVVLPGPDQEPPPGEPDGELAPRTDTPPLPIAGTGSRVLRLLGEVPPEVWNRIGTRLIPKLRSGKGLKLGVDLSVRVDAALAPDFEAELRLALEDLDLSKEVRVEVSEADQL